MGPDHPRIASHRWFSRVESGEAAAFRLLLNSVYGRVATANPLMCKRLPVLVLSLAVLGAAAPVRAGVDRAPAGSACAAAAQRNVGDRVAPPLLRPDARTIADIHWLPLHQPGDRSASPRHTAVPVAVASPTAEITAHVPAPPSGLALGLSALASLGAYRAGRSLRKLHLGALPDWYHPGGAVQIGHATPLDLEFAAPPACAFAQPAAPPPVARPFWDVGWGFRAQCIPCTAVPRGPPLSSCG